MNFYDDLVMQTQMNYSKYYPIYASGSTPYQLTDKKPLPYSGQYQPTPVMNDLKALMPICRRWVLSTLINQFAS